MEMMEKRGDSVCLSFHDVGYHVKVKSRCAESRKQIIKEIRLSELWLIIYLFNWLKSDLNNWDDLENNKLWLFKKLLFLTNATLPQL